ncbi:MAG TPA: amidohydrolase family protein [Bordetella sp.]|nr:amidohydrolase family protein [Bordetella sp.]
MQPVYTPHLGIRPDWLARHREEILDPQLPIIDPHHHLWDRLGSRYLMHEFLEDIGQGHDIRASVYIQCRSMLRAHGPREMAPLGEVAFACGVAAMSESGEYGDAQLCKGIVAGADLLLGDDVVPVLEAMLRIAGGRLRGMRNTVVWHADPQVRSSTLAPPAGLLGDPRFRRGVAALGRYGLALDAWIYHTQHDELYALARALPDVTVVIDHFGGPIGIGPYAGQRDAAFADWRRGLAQLARLPNVMIKLGGAGMPIFGIRFDHQETPPSSAQLADAWRPYAETCIELFGVKRCMFESNFAVDKGMFSYHVLWNAFKRLAAKATAAEKAALFHDTANVVYRLGLPPLAE